MRFTALFAPTLKDDPADAEVVSHKLLTRAGMIRQVARGIYDFLPLGLRTLRKVERIVREELDAAGCQEILMPAVCPAELWQESGRWDRYGKELLRIKDRHERDFCFGPTHEEVVTDIVRKTVRSYRDLPKNLYQIQTKFRDEIRPRFGLMRGREFIMMDAYSFDADQKGLDEAYAKMDRAYRRMFERCGLRFRAVDADAGAIGGSGSQEFMVLADTGEDTILFCSKCDYAANVEKCVSIPAVAPAAGEPRPLEKHATPSVKTVAQLIEFFKLPAAAMAKTVLYQAVYADREEVVAVMMRGDLEINEVKLANALDALAVKLADEQTIQKATGAEVGFAGPVRLSDKVKLLADKTLKERSNLLTGCNETGFHCLNVNLGRDARMPEFKDLRSSKAGELCVKCRSPLVQARGIEVGHIFKLGTKYSSKMEATFMGQNGKPTPFVMGCYGIGVSRIAAAAIEQNHDDKGIIWPAPIAPFEVAVAVLDTKRDAQVALAEKLYGELKAAGIDACLDDRPLSPGAKFKDLDLLGFPVQVIVGRRAEEQVIELVVRMGSQKSEVPAADVLARCRTALSG